MASLAIAMLLGLGLSATAAADAADNRDPRGPTPTIVFVHAGWADSSGWNQELTNLEPEVTGAERLRGDTRADYRDQEQRGADELGERAEEGGSRRSNWA